METDNYLQLISGMPEEITTLPAELMPTTKKQSVTVLAKWPEQYYVALRPKTIEDAVCSITPSLSTFRKETNETSLFAILTILFNDIIDFFSVGRSIGQSQLVSTIQLVVEDFYYLNIEDFKLCFNNAKRGVYGKIYDRVDGNIIYGWIAQYAKDRAYFCESMDDKYKTVDTSERISTRSKNEDRMCRISEIQHKYGKNVTK